MYVSEMHAKSMEVYLTLGSEEPPNPVEAGGKSESSKYGCQEGREGDYESDYG